MENLRDSLKISEIFSGVVVIIVINRSPSSAFRWTFHGLFLRVVNWHYMAINKDIINIKGPHILRPFKFNFLQFSNSLKNVTFDTNFEHLLVYLESPIDPRL